MMTIRYLHPKPLLRSPQLSVRGLGIREVMPPAIVERPHGTGDFLFMLFHDAVQWGPPPQTRQLQPGTVVLWDRSASHYYGHAAARWSHSWVHCDGPAVRDMLRAAGAACGHPRLALDPARIDRYLFDLHEEITGPHRTDTVIVRNTLENIVREMVRSGRVSRQPLVPDVFLRIRQKLDTRYDQRLTLNDLASEARMSIPHLCTQFRRHFGVPPITYLIRRRMHAAAALLRETVTPVGEVGRLVGCDDPFHFSKLFKASFGVPPSSLRRSAANARKPPAR
jgi:AraC family transcriptional regulator of arabinose operon